MSRKLLLMRHADTLYGGVRDEERVLSKRGIKQAVQAGYRIAQWMEGGVVMHSPAQRARSTAQLACQDADVEFIEEDALYWGNEDDILDSIPLLNRPLLVVGHSPSIPLTASYIASKEGSEAILQRGCPTATVFVFDVPADLQRLGSGSCTLVDILITPKGV